MRILLVHGYGGPPPFGKAWLEGWMQRISTGGIQVDGFYAGIGARDPRLPFAALDMRWRRGDRELLRMYEDLARLASGYDVLINYGAINLHPRFLESFSLTTVLGFFDDPESSDEYSRPVAASHDLCMVGNIAELDAYRHWGAKEVAWWPMGFRATDYDPTLRREEILRGRRDVDVVLLCERLTHWRRAKVDRFAKAFPTGIYRGPGWPAGFLPEAERVPLLQRTKVGINIHNSTGPINFRTFYLPANGVMQICDNRSHLGRVYEIGKEVAGFDSIEEAIDLCHYYLAHEDERRAIATAGWQRALRDYNEREAFAHVVRAVQNLPIAGKSIRSISMSRHRRRTLPTRLVDTVAAPVTRPIRYAPRLARGLYRRYLRLRDNMRLRMNIDTTGEANERG